MSDAQVIEAVVDARTRRMEAGIRGLYDKARPLITRHVTQELEDIADAGYHVVAEGQAVVVKGTALTRISGQQRQWEATATFLRPFIDEAPTT